MKQNYNVNFAHVIHLNTGEKIHVLKIAKQAENLLTCIK